MGHWYATLKEKTKTSQNRTDKTDKTSENGVLSVLSVHNLGKTENFSKSSTSQSENQKSVEVIILDAVRAGSWSPGMIARASRLGVSKAYQEIDRLLSEGKLHHARDGILTVVNADERDG
ncbi:MAG: hypothetical protein GY761_04495 [Hyphomicrobiales bacterium]|nr:hypothetical protein [Hyphomicrobiales bacterium]